MVRSAGKPCLRMARHRLRLCAKGSRVRRPRQVSELIGVPSLSRFGHRCAVESPSQSGCCSPPGSVREPPLQLISAARNGRSRMCICKWTLLIEMDKAGHHSIPAPCQPEPDRRRSFALHRPGATQPPSEKPPARRLQESYILAVGREKANETQTGGRGRQHSIQEGFPSPSPHMRRIRTDGISVSRVDACLYRPLTLRGSLP